MNRTEHYLVADEVTKGIYEAYPELAERYGEEGKKKCYEDNLYHMRYLDTALLQNDVDVFVDYALWLNRILTARGMKAEHLIDNFERIAAAIPGKLPPEQATPFATYLSAANRALRETEQGGGGAV
jgi:hypothetical protein